MKTLLLAVLLISTLLAGASPTTKEERCERLVNADMNTLDMVIQNDLIDGIWSFDHAGIEQTLQFFENGMAEIISISDYRRSVERRLWSVASDGGIVYLFLEDADGYLNMYYLRADCEGIKLEDMYSGKLTTLEFLPTESDLYYNLKNSQLLGRWFNPDAGSSWQFREDGSFSSLDSTNRHAAGYWELARDAQHILLYFSKTGDPENVYKTSVLKIEELDFEDLSFSNSDAVGDPRHDLQYFIKS